MFERVLNTEVVRQQVPVGEVEFRQSHRELFRRMAVTSGPPPTEPVAPVVVPVVQTDRKLFGRIVEGRADTPSPVVDGWAVVVPAGVWDHDFFTTVVRRDLGRRAARRGAWALAATVVQISMVTATAFVTAHLAALAADEQEALPVEIVAPRVARTTPRPPPPPAAAPAGARRAGPAKPRPPGYKPPVVTALLQPRDVQDVMKAPSPNEPPEEVEYAGEEEGGVVGGIAGWVPESDGAAPRAGGEIEEAPQYATAGFRRPAEADPGCVRRSVRLPPELAGFVSGTLTLKFGIGREGTVGTLQIVGQELDPRVVEAIRRAVTGCRWIAGADTRGQPVAIWVVMPMRFESD
jgi:protein TonB